MRHGKEPPGGGRQRESGHWDLWARQTATLSRLTMRRMGRKLGQITEQRRAQQKMGPILNLTGTIRSEIRKESSG